VRDRRIGCDVSAQERCDGYGMKQFVAVAQTLARKHRANFYNHSVLCISLESEYRFLVFKLMDKYAIQKGGFIQNPGRIRRLAANQKFKFRDV
jgi:hypothetical protein